MLLPRGTTLGMRASCHLRLYTTSAPRIPKKAAGAFTSNKHISQPVTLNKTLVYIGPFADSVQRYKMVASLFGVCGLCAVPGLLSTGQAPALSVIMAGVSAIMPAGFIHMYTRNLVTRLMVYDDVKTVERERRRPGDMKNDKWLGIETVSVFGRLKEHNMWLADLKDVTPSQQQSKMVLWEKQNKKTSGRGPSRRYALERAVVEADPYLQGLADRCTKQ
ncbi:hypothetical protein BDB00DRAFT_811421 [Zychaea mexicana]|uniref:uncharacterized protein n=1 Tax=Zychaea mexicana TaxID=64656 RepID=UPI0022FDBAE1|nr:uncharacterized protein BDB00DRAFT_811421 [Zychaea mexicana]KAI9496021.1 hypothetical protein BDB00DRAFT_811421 [Zychaea mexicana]